MTNDEKVVAEVDASKHYSQGQMLQVVRKPFNMLGIQFSNQGILPAELSGTYTDASKALIAIKGFLNHRSEYFEKVARKKNAKVQRKSTKKEVTNTEE